MRQKDPRIFAACTREETCPFARARSGVRLGDRCASLPAAMAHAFAEFLAFLGRHLLPALHHLAPPRHAARPRPKSSEQQAAEDHESQRLPERNQPESEERRHQEVPQVHDHKPKGSEAEGYEGCDFQCSKYPVPFHVRCPLYSGLFWRISRKTRT